VKKFGWAPDIILCEGFMAGLIPFFLRTAYKTEPLFTHAALVYGLFDMPYEHMTERFFAKAAINNLKEGDLDVFRNPDGSASIHRGASAYSDAIIIGSESFDANVDYLTAGNAKIVQLWDTEETFFSNTLATFNALIEATVEG
jgi:starch synthase